MSEIAQATGYLAGSEDITILIASFNRSWQILPIIDYYLDFGFYVKVAYDSENPILLENPRLKLYRSNESYASRCEWLSRDIKSKFAILVTDDDLFIAEAIVEMKKSLQKSVYMSIFGQAVGSWYNNGKCQVSPAYLRFESYSNFASDASERVLNQYTPQEITPIGMYRLTYSRTLSRMLELFGKLNFASTPYIYENSAEVFINYCGTSFRSFELYWIRNWDGESISNSNWDRSLSFLEWFNQDDFLEERNRWLEIIHDYCPDLDISRLTHLFESNWKREVGGDDNSIQLFSKHIRFSRRLRDFLRHRYSNYYSPHTLYRKVDWSYNPDVLDSLLNTMYLNRVIR